MIEALGFMVSGVAFLYCAMELAPRVFEPVSDKRDDRLFLGGVLSLLLAVGFFGALVERLCNF